ncbi:MAG: Carboxypeptidase G2 precursor [candidate division WS6 bacterium OLB20]|uniref:Carboxypeptidase G2 n=1 Tax=candidate division WS6 bacterium OLB20 TaxID=1617426 RepID=A0A136LXZ1_9BACT|nr:MAG: Carboxypeptidase G2 precursor [candidate division WS6 bacterium OLB20]
MKYSQMDRQRLLDELIQLLSIDTHFENIPGMTAGIDFYESLLAETGLAIERRQVAGRAPFLIARSPDFDKAKPSVLLSGHIETILPADTDRILIQKDRLTGSGTQDMKGGLMVIIALLRELAAAGEMKNVTVAVSTEEEQGPRNRYKHVLEELARDQDFIMVFESTLDGIDSPAARDRSVVRSRKGLAYVDLTITADGGHSGVLGRKEQRKSAILKAAELITTLEEKVADYSSGTTVNTGQITAGSGFAVLAEHADLKIDIRYIFDYERERVLAWIEKQVEAINNEDGFGASFSVGLDFPPLQPSQATGAFLDVVASVARDQDRTLHIEDRGGGSEANLFSRANPDAAVLDGFGVRGDLQHTSQEYMLTESLFDAAEFATAVVRFLLD